MNFARPPYDVATDTMRWSRVSAGATRSCGIALDGRVHCWGSNVWGALGRGEPFTGTLPELLNRPRGPIAMGVAHDISVGTGEHACALGVSAARCWGANGIGQLGAGRVLEDADTHLYLSTVPVDVRLR